MSIGIDSILNETESSLERQCRNMEFCYEIMEQNREMEAFVNECLIKASGNKKAIQEMYILTEAAFGDKMKAFFQRIKDFFKKIFSKLGAAMTAMFSEQKKYCENYAKIITTCKYQAGDKEMTNHFVGVPRILDVINGDTEQALFGQAQDKGYIDNQARVINATNITDLRVPDKIDTNTERDRLFNELKSKNAYWQNKNITDEKTDDGQNISIENTFKNYFTGGADTVSVSTEKIEENFQIAINVVYAGQSYISKLEKFVTTVTKKMDKIDEETTEGLKKLESDLKAKVSANKTAQPSQSGPAVFKKDNFDADKKTLTSDDGKVTIHINNVDKKEDVEKALASHFNTAPNDTNGKWSYSESVIYETIKDSGTTSSNSENSKATKNYNGTAADDIKNVTDKNSEIGNKTVSSVAGNNASATQAKDDKLVTDYMSMVTTNVQAEVNAVTQIAKTIVNSAFTAFKSANTDFFELIKMHVNWYLSNPGSEDDNANKTSRTRNLNMNAGNAVDTK